MVYRVSYDAKKSFQSIHQFCSQYSFTKEQHYKNKLIYGENKINVSLSFLWQIFTNEFLNPFYLLQLLSIAFWFYQEYVIYATVVIFLTILSTGSTLIDMFEVINTLRRENKFLEPVFAGFSHSNSEQYNELIESESVVPGMLCKITKPQRISSDCILISGRCYVKETSVTGDSQPKLKRPLPVETEGQVVYDIMKHRENTIYGGSMINNLSEPCELLVINTGFNTVQGSLIKNMLYPQKDRFVQYEDALWFALFLAILSLIGFSICLPTFLSQQFSLRVLFENLFDLFTVAVPPILPAAMSIGTSLAIGRLREHWIFCVSPAKVAVAGKATIVCIDARGGLVEEDMAFVGYRIVKLPVVKENSDGLLPIFGRHNNRVETVAKYISLDNAENDCNKERKVHFAHSLATCHLLTLNKDTIIGTREDSEMFASTGATLVYEEGNPLISDSELIIKMNEGKVVFRQQRRYFNDKKRVLSVVVKCGEDFWAYARASPKSLVEMCKADEIPHYWREMFSSYEKEGQVVFGMCAKKLTSFEIANKDWEEILINMDLVGIVVLQLILKQNAWEMVRTLKAANIQCQMFCSETPNVAVAVAKMAGIIDPRETIMFGKETKFSDVHQPLNVQWLKIESSEEGDKQHLLGIDDIEIGTDKNLEEANAPIDLIKDQNIMVNDLKNAALVYDQNVTEQILAQPTESHSRSLLKQTRIFAGMICGAGSVDIISNLSRGGESVLMVGSPYSEYGALSKSDAGVLLSITKQVCVFASFTCARNDPAGIPSIIAEGRAALVTSYECFKWMAISSIIQFTSTTMLYYYSLSFSDEQYLFVDLFLVLPLAFTMSLSKPSGKLTREQPQSSLLSGIVLLSVSGQMVIQMAAQVMNN